MNNKFVSNQLKTFQEVLTTEANAISEMIDYVDESFAMAVQIILESTGRTILTGIGKSGHIANKIASTLASTGTPAFFVHPAEAAHGDLGMIVNGDVVVALSNSGESDEILTLIPALKHKKIKIIAITGRIQSTLAKAADVHIFTKITKEACPLGLAPTTSTTVSLAIGDALAVALLTERHFNKHDFALSHPAGSLGKSLLTKVSDLMVTGEELPIVAPSDNLQDTIIIMTQKGLGLATIVNEHNVILGIFTDGDLRRLFQKTQDIINHKINDVMNYHPQTISANQLASEALHIMQNKKITSLLVSDENNHLLGIITMHLILTAGIV